MLTCRVESNGIIYALCGLPYVPYDSAQIY
jgi:hypothetical protein